MDTIIPDCSPEKSSQSENTNGEFKQYFNSKRELYRKDIRRQLNN